MSEIILRLTNRISHSKEVKSKLGTVLYKNSADKLAYSSHIMRSANVESHEEKLVLSKILYGEEKYFEAQKNLEMLLGDSDFCYNKHVLELSFKCYLKTGNLKLANRILHQILDLEPESFHLLDSIYIPYRRANMKKELVRAFSRSKRNGLIWPFGTQHDFISLQDKSIKNNNPSILINCLPKSASTSIANLLKDQFEMSACNIGLSFFPEEILIPNWMAAFKRGGAICVQHIDASEENLELLKRFNILSLVIHLRDPRQAILSWTYYLDTRFSDTKIHTLKSLTSPSIPASYQSWDFEDKLTWNIENYFPLFVKWVSDWCDVEEDQKSIFEIKFTTFEELCGSEKKFLQDLVDFWGLDTKSQKLIEFDKYRNYNFRKGQVSEWKSTMTKKQIELLKGYWDKKFNSKFGWESF